MLSSVRNSMDDEVTRENDLEVRWKAYFVQLLNGEEAKEVEVRRERIRGNERVVRKVVRVGHNGCAQEDERW